jgi:predicted nucleotidyltransferase
MAGIIDCPEVKFILEELLSEAQQVLGEQFVGLYLSGSLASGDFEPQTSDIDFLVVTEGNAAIAESNVIGTEGEVVRAEGLPPLRDPIALNLYGYAQLRDLHTWLLASGNPWAKKLEGAYVPRETLRRHDPNAPACPCTNEGQFYLAALGSDWILQRYILREQGVVLAGPPLDTLIDPVSTDEVRQAVCSYLEDWWKPMISRSPEVPFRLEDDAYQAYTVLSMCRALYTLRHGGILSKPAAARWALQALDSPWHPLVRRALDWRPGSRMDALEETMALVQYTVECIEQSARTLGA